MTTRIKKEGSSKLELFVFLVATIGAAVGIKGLFIFDELNFILLAIFLVLSHNWRQRVIKKSRLNLELLFLFFLLINSCFATFSTDLDFINKIRYVLVFLSLILYYISSDGYTISEEEQKRKISFAVNCLTLYFLATFLQGYIVEQIVGLHTAEV